MTSYNVLITSDDPAKPRINLRFDDGSGTPVLRELTLQADSSAGLLAGDLPVLDLNLVVRAVTAALLPTPPAAPAVLADSAAGQQVTDGQDEVRPPVPGPRRAGRLGRESADTASTATTRLAAKSATKSMTADATNAKSTAPKKSAAKKVQGRKSTGSGAGAGAGAGSGRVYRRLPDDIAEVIKQTGNNAPAIADHYGVPKHTAYGWIRSHNKHAAAPALT